MTAPGPAGRGRRVERELLSSQLSDRERAILSDLARVRLLTGRLIRRLHFNEHSPLTQARRTRAVLQRLFDLGLVVRLERRVGGVRSGSAGYTYGLTSLGQRLVTDRGPAGGTRRRRPWEPTANFVDHILGVAELYVRLREAEPAEAVDTLLRFDAEPAAWRWWSGPSGEQLVLKPDAFAVWSAGADDRLAFVEVDRSTESQRVIQHKADTYITYWQSGTEQRREGAFPIVLFVVPDKERQAALVDTLSRLDPETWQLFQVVVGTDAATAALTGRPPPDQLATAESN